MKEVLLGAAYVIRSLHDFVIFGRASSWEQLWMEMFHNNVIVVQLFFSHFWEVNALFFTS